MQDLIVGRTDLPSISGPIRLVNSESGCSPVLSSTPLDGTGPTVALGGTHPQKSAESVQIMAEHPAQSGSASADSGPKLPQHRTRLGRHRPDLAEIGARGGSGQLWSDRVEAEDAVPSKGDDEQHQQPSQMSTELKCGRTEPKGGPRLYFETLVGRTKSNLLFVLAPRVRAAR